VAEVRSGKAQRNEPDGDVKLGHVAVQWAASPVEELKISVLPPVMERAPANSAAPAAAQLAPSGIESKRTSLSLLGVDPDIISRRSSSVVSDDSSVDFEAERERQDRQRQVLRGIGEDV